MVAPFLRHPSEFALLWSSVVWQTISWGKKNAERIRRGKTSHLHVQFHTAAIPDALEMLSFLPRNSHFTLLCNLFLAHFNALESYAAPFQLIKVIPKWLLASMEMGVKGMKYMSVKQPRQ